MFGVTKKYLFCFLLLMPFMVLSQSESRTLFNEKYGIEEINQSKHFDDYENDISNENDTLSKIDALFQSNSLLNSIKKNSKIDSNLNFLSPKQLLTNKFKDSKNSLLNLGSDQNLNNDISDKKKSILSNASFNNQINIESQYSNTVLPLFAYEPYYTRIWGNSQLTLLNLPFDVDFFYTTESQEFFNSNYVTFRFNPHQFRENLMKGGKDKINESKNAIKDLENQKNCLNTYKADLKRSVKNLDNVYGKYENELSALASNYADSLKNLESNAQASLNTAVDKNKAQLMDSLEKSKSQVSNSMEEKKSDNLSKIDSSQTHLENDSNLQKIQAMYNQYNSYQEKKQKINRYIAQADSLIQKIERAQKHYQDISNQYKKLNDPKEIAKMDSLKPDKLKMLAFLTHIDDIEIGLINPFYSKSSLNGAPIKGISVSQSFDKLKLFYNQTAGKLAQPFLMGFNENNRTNFTQNIIANKVGFGSEYGSNISFISINIWDPISLNEENKIGRNFIQGVNSTLSNQKAFINFELLHSISDLALVPMNVSEHQFQFKPNYLNNFSFFSEASYKPSDNITLGAIWDQKNEEFSSFAAPFVRNNFRQVEFKMQSFLLKKKVNLSTFYQIFTDNLSGLAPQTNSMNGMGLTISSQFKKYPNFLLSYTPYQQRMDNVNQLNPNTNSFSNYIANVNYQKKHRNHFFFSNLNYTYAVMEFFTLNDVKLIQTNLTSFNQSYANQKIRINLNLMRSVTSPSIDTLNHNALNLSIHIKKKKYTIDNQLRAKKDFENGIYAINYLGFTTIVLKRINLSLSQGVGTLSNMYGFEKRTIFESRVRVGYDLNLQRKE